MIAKVIEDFITFYKNTMVDEISPALRVGDNLNALKDYVSEENWPAVKRINSGDCYTAAVAIGLTLAHHGYEITYMYNGHHGYLKIGDRYYDTLFPHGRDATELILGESKNNKGTPVTKTFFINDLIGIDNLGVAMINYFVERQTGNCPDLKQMDNTYSVIVTRLKSLKYGKTAEKRLAPKD